MKRRVGPENVIGSWSKKKRKLTNQEGGKRKKFGENGVRMMQFLLKRLLPPRNQAC
jgi:hypothetical protein